METVVVGIGLLAFAAVVALWLLARRQSGAIEHGAISGSWLAEQKRVSDDR